MWGKNLMRNVETKNQLSFLNDFNDDLQPINIKKNKKKNKLIGVDSEGNPMGYSESNIEARRQWNVAVNANYNSKHLMGKTEQNEYKMAAESSKYNYGFMVPLPQHKIRTSLYYIQF